MRVREKRKKFSVSGSGSPFVLVSPKGDKTQSQNPTRVEHFGYFSPEVSGQVTRLANRL